MADEWKPVFSAVIISDLILCFSSLISDPLYLSYFIFFSPYLLKLASFLSPLFFIIVLSCIVCEKDSHEDDDLGMYEAIFGTLEISEENQEPSLGFEEKESKPRPVSEPKNIPLPMAEEKKLENFLKILDRFEKLSKVDDKLHSKKTGANNIKVKPTIISDVSSDISSDIDRKGESFGTWDRSRNNSCSFGSVRKGREWKRTLACKLFEERHNVDGGEGMDSLWEAYEKGSNKMTVVKETMERKKMKKKTSKVEFRQGSDSEDEVVGGQLCCLPSIGKTKLGMGRPNLGKISKAIKGLGWLKHSKKVHNNNGDRY